MGDNFFRNLVEDLKDEDTSLASDGLGSAEFGDFIDVGSYSLNALVSGSLFGGFPDNKVIGLAGEQATGKTFFVLGAAKNFLDKYPGSGFVYFDTEGAVTKGMMAERGVDPSRVIISEPTTVQHFRTKALQMLDKYIETPIKKRPRMMFVLDSLGQLPTNKEVEDSTSGSDTRDMTRAQQIKSAFRVLTLKCARAKVPMLVTNHTYDKVGSYIPGKEIGGGGGLKYAASIILTLTKGKDKDDDKTVSGAIVKVTTYKSRLTKENQTCKTLITFDRGLDRYYGLMDLALKAGILEKRPKNYTFVPTGEVVTEKDIQRHPEKIFTQEILEQLDVLAAKEYRYGQGGEPPEEDADEEV
jgi:RecA/RadA recombinase